MDNLNINNIEKIFVINLKRRADRLEKFLKKVKYLPKFEIFKAIDGKELKYDNSYNLLYFGNKILENNLIKKIKGLKVGEIGCFLSHYFIWKKIIQLDKPCLIFEDDANICDDYTNKLNIIFEKGIPENFDILWIGIRQHYIQNKIYNQTIKPNKEKLINNHFYNYVNRIYDPFYPYNYIISPNTCKKLCNIFENNNSSFPAVDHFISRQKFTNNYIIINNDTEHFLCNAEQRDSDIQIYGNKKINNKFL